MNEKEIIYDSTNNIKLSGLLSKVKNNSKIVILCHGINSNKSEKGCFDKLTSQLFENNINSFRFDFRGHGESSGHDYEMTIKKEIDDLIATIEMLKQQGYDEFIILGASFGAGIVSLLNHANYNIKGLILWYGALDYKQLPIDYNTPENRKKALEIGYHEITSPTTGRKFKLGQNLIEECDQLVPYENLVKSELPILFVHGTADSQVPYTISENIATLCMNSKLVLIDNTEHCFFGPEGALKTATQETVNFIKSLNWDYDYTK